MKRYENEEKSDSDGYGHLVVLNQIVIYETARAHGLEFDDAAEYAKYLYPGEELLIPLGKD